MFELRPVGAPDDALRRARESARGRAARSPQASDPAAGHQPVGAADLRARHAARPEQVHRDRTQRPRLILAVAGVDIGDNDRSPTGSCMRRTQLGVLQQEIRLDVQHRPASRAPRPRHHRFRRSSSSVRRCARRSCKRTPRTPPWCSARWSASVKLRIGVDHAAQAALALGERIAGSKRCPSNGPRGCTMTPALDPTTVAMPKKCSIGAAGGVYRRFST